MSRKTNSNKTFIYRYLALALVLAALIVATVGTLAWLRYYRSLQTMTLVQVSDLALEGPAKDTLAIDLGDIDAQGGARYYVFGVNAHLLSQCQIQLAHTTNIPLSYAIYHATKSDSQTDGALGPYAGNTYFAKGNVVQGDYLKDTENDYAATRAYQATYNTGDSVQDNAVPKYWVSSAPVLITSGDISYFLLEVTPLSKATNNKETDMVYLTVGTVTGGGTTETTQGGG